MRKTSICFEIGSNRALRHMSVLVGKKFSFLAASQVGLVELLALRLFQGALEEVAIFKAPLEELALALAFPAFITCYSLLDLASSLQVDSG